VVLIAIACLTAMATLTNAFGEKTVTPTAVDKRFVFWWESIAMSALGH
jgi:hypothetical protein